MDRAPAPDQGVVEMAQGCQELDPANLADAFNANGRGYRETSELEITDLAAFFAVCARRSLGLVGTM